MNDRKTVKNKLETDRIQCKTINSIDSVGIFENSLRVWTIDGTHAVIFEEDREAHFESTDDQMY